jgi:hypothetical protein
MLQADIAALGSQVMANQVAQPRRQDLPKPTQQLLLAITPELGKVTVRPQKGFLHQVGSIDFALETAADLEASQEQQIIPVQLQKPTEGRPTPRAGKAQEPFRVRLRVGIHGGVPSL